MAYWEFDTATTVTSSMMTGLADNGAPKSMKSGAMEDES